MATQNSIDTLKPIGVDDGGTGAATLTDHGMLVGSGAGAITALGVATDGQIPIGSTGIDPVLATITGGDHLSVTNGAGTITLEGSHTADAFSGFDTWDGGSPYYDDTVLGDFELLQSGSGFILGVEVSWTAPQTATGMTEGNAYYIYIDSAGDIQKTSTYSDALYTDNIVLFQCWRDAAAPTNNQSTVKENHPYRFPTETSNYLHNTVGTVIENANNGANITLSGTQKIEISGADELDDHGLETDIPDSGGTPETFAKLYTNGAGKWVKHSASDTFTGNWNDAGTVSALGGGKYAIYTLYVGKDTLNTSTPRFGAILNTAQYNNLTAAQTAISNGVPDLTTNELAAMEQARLGYIIYSESSTAIVDVIIDKNTLRSGSSTTGTNQASLISTTTTNFDGILSSADTTVQSALDTIDDWGASTTDHALLLGNGTGTAIGALAVGATGETIMGSTGADPGWTASPSFGGSVTAATGLTVTANDVAISSGKLTMPTTTSADGQITINGTRVFHTYGTDNVFVGSGSGNFTLSGANYNCGVGTDTLSALTSGDENVAFGYHVLDSVQDGSYNCGFAQNVLTACTSGTRNIGFGRNALVALTTGNRNVAIGYEAGKNYTSTEDSNLMLYNNGTVGESHVIRIGAQGSGNYQQNKCWIAGIYNTAPTGGSDNVVVIDSTGQLGAQASLDVANGGSGAATLTDHGVLVGSGTGAITPLAVGTNGQVLVGSSAADPVFATITDGYGISVTGGAGSVTISNSTTLNDQTGTTYTLQLTDSFKVITCTNGAAITVTVPTNAAVAFPIGTQIALFQGGAGQITLSGAIPPTLKSADNAYTTVKLYSVCGITKIASDVWMVYGDVEA